MLMYYNILIVATEIDNNKNQYEQNEANKNIKTKIKKKRQNITDHEMNRPFILIDRMCEKYWWILWMV